jgi:hypothetical protein
VFPDFELADHRGVHRKLSELHGGDPLVLVLARGASVRKTEGSTKDSCNSGPTVEELRLDLRAVLHRCRPDWDIGSPE